MVKIETPITLEEQVVLMKKYVSFRQRAKMQKFLLYAGYFRASRYGKFCVMQDTSGRADMVNFCFPMWRI